jgi:hypothetical protein
MFQDEARFGRITDPRRCWAPFPLRPICKAMLTRQYTYAYAAVNVDNGALDTLMFPFANTECMQIFLDEVAARHPENRIVMIMDGAGWHRSETLKAPKNMVLIKLPPYSPELNPVENLWDELREKFFGNVVFDSLDALEIHLEASLKKFESQCDKIHSIVAWPWIINSLIN